MARRNHVYRNFKKLFRWLGVLVLFGVIAYVTAFLNSGTTTSTLSGNARAVDGDTLVIADKRVRILDIDAPELGQKCKDKDGRAWDCGRAAANRLAQLLKGQPTVCRAEGQDKYRRILATCYVNDRDVASILVREGLALGSDEYLAEHVSARSRKVGIWAGTFETPRNWRDRQKTKGEMNIFDMVWQAVFGSKG